MYDHLFVSLVEAEPLRLVKARGGGRVASVPTSGTTAGRSTMNTQTSVLVARWAENAMSNYANVASSAFHLTILCAL